MIQITINGSVCQVEPGTKVLKAATDNGVYIPTLCNHPALEPWGGCRMCVVEVKRPGEAEASITTACTLEAEDGMVIETDTDAIKNQRKLAMELILSNHPAECDGCPKYGNCELQSMIQYIGVSAVRTVHKPMTSPRNDENPIISHDMKRCIKCGRCVRMCHEVRGVKAIDFTRGKKNTVIVAPADGLLIDSDCRFCTACVAVCPTGSIVERLKKEGQELVPCQAECPAHIDIPAYIRAVREGETRRRRGHHQGEGALPPDPGLHLQPPVRGRLQAHRHQRSPVHPQSEAVRRGARRGSGVEREGH